MRNIVQPLAWAMLGGGLAVVGSAGAIDLPWLHAKGQSAPAAQTAAALPAADPLPALQPGSAPNYRAIVQRYGPSVVGIAHALFHASTWADTQCYLQDLFTADDVRGQGVAAALIDHLAHLAHARGADRLHWLTHHSNARARQLYDRVAVNKGFIRYDHPMPP